MPRCLVRCRGDRRPKIRHRGGRTVRMIPDRRNDGEKIRAGGDQRTAILRRNAPDGDAGHRRCLRPPVQNFGIRRSGRLLGRRCEECPESNIIHPRLGGFDRQMAGRLARHADDGVRAQQAARLGIAGVVLSHMDAVAAGRNTSAARRIASSSTSFRRSCTHAAPPASSAAFRCSAKPARSSSRGGVIK
jgi:hypothetical protein